MPQRLNPYTVAPHAIAALVAVEKYLDESGLDPKLMLLVKTRVSQINGCEYCLHLHTEDARKRGETETRLYLLDAWHESELFTEKERVALEWAEALTFIRETRAPDDAFEKVRRHFSEKETLDLSVVIAMINAWNRLAIGARMVHPHDRVKAA